LAARITGEDYLMMYLYYVYKKIGIKRRTL
jgi:hypothetical protein